MNDNKTTLSLNELERHLWKAALIITGLINESDSTTTGKYTLRCSRILSGTNWRH
jgi:hypothetical protein